MNITSLLAPVAMDINNFNANNYDNIRGQTLSHSKTNLRTVSMYSSKASEVYHAKMEWLNDLPNKEFRDLIDSSQLSYNNSREREIQVSRATNHENKMRN